MPGSGLFSGSPSADWFANWTAENEGCMTASEVSRFDDSDAQLAAGESDGTDNLTLLSNAPKPAPFDAVADYNSDLAFENGYAFGGNYDGVQIWDVRNGQTPALASTIDCPGSQNDVTVNDGILVTSTDSVRNKAECLGNVSVPTTSAEYGKATQLGGPADLRRPQPVRTGVRRRGAHRLRLAHPHGAARA